LETAVPKKTYAPETKSAFLQAAIAVRGSGKSWTDALKAAMAAGYKGSEKGLVKMIRVGRPKPGPKPKTEVKSEMVPQAAPDQAQAAPAPAPKPAPARKQPRKTRAKARRKTAPKNRGRATYSPKAKARILQAVTNARASGKKWPEAHKAAAAAGYLGGLPALMVLVKNAQPAKKRGRPAKAALVAKPRTRALGGLSEVGRIVESQIKARVNAAIQAVIENLKSLSR
jgi:hypothetical protein